MEKYTSYFLNKLIKTVKENNLFSWGDSVAVAVSGGVDSSVLLYSLHELRHYFGINISCISFDHSIRPDSAEDINFVKSVCEALSIPLYAGKSDVKSYSRDFKVSLEEACRILRYKFIMESAINSGANKIAVAHHLDDFAENFLMRITTGGGTGSISGIPVVNGMIIRPLIKHTKKEITRFAETNGIKFREDSTNFDSTIFRNYIRLKVIPQLKKYNKSLLNTIYNTSTILRKDDDYLNETAIELLKRISSLSYSSLSSGEGEIDFPVISAVNFDKNDLSSISEPILYRLLKFSSLSIGHNSLFSSSDYFQDANYYEGSNISFQQFDFFKRLVKSKKANTFFNINGRLLVRKEYEKIIIESAMNNYFLFGHCHFNLPARYEGYSYSINKEDFIANFYEISIKEIGNNIFVGKLPEAKAGPLKNALMSEKARRLRNTSSRNRSTVFFDFDKVSFPIIIRPFEHGDLFKPLGASGRKKLKSYYIDKKIPLKARKILPVVVFNGNISWVSLNALSDDIKVDKRTDNIGIMGIRSIKHAFFDRHFTNVRK